ncbi:hypothetical protein PINS_up003231 [Pythium insidiosum]|nr:hypothetical protein PINS_up003231 [Pythium insidiosum]
MVITGQASQSCNKKKFKVHKKKRAEVRNQKKVRDLQHGKVNVLRKHRPSKKKQQKDSKRRRIYVESEKAKLLKSGLITKEDIENLEAGEDSNEDSVEGGMDVEN